MDRASITQLELPLNNLVHLAESDYKEKPSIFLLHGFGSNMKDLFGLTPFFGEGWNCISLQASIQIQYDGWGWAELDPMNIRRLPKPEQISLHFNMISRSIEQTIDELELDKEKINLLGFSQGASLSIYCGLKSHETFKTVVALCGYVPEDNIREGIHKSEERDIEFFMGNGTLDQIVTLPIAQASRDYLNSIGISLHYNEYESGHTIPNDCLNDTLQWLNHHNDFDVASDYNKSQQYDPDTGNYPPINKKPR